MGALVLIGIGLAFILFRASRPTGGLSQAIPRTPSLQEDVETEIRQEETKGSVPIPGISGAAWKKYVERQKRGALNTRNPGWGLFLMHPRALEDLGMATSEGLRHFWGSVAIQYRVFAGHTVLQAKTILSRYPDVIGQMITPTGEKQAYQVTLSGLLGIAHRTGMGGLEKWVNPQKPEDQFPATTAEFKRVNGIF